LSGNTSTWALDMLINNQDKIYWIGLTMNESAMQLLEKNQNKINWPCLELNRSLYAIHLLEKNQDKIEDWYGLFQNSHIFKYDYKKMKDNCMLFKDDLIKNRFHPCNIPKFKDWGINGFK